MAKFPDAVVRLTQIDSNAFSILGHTTRALKAANATDEQIAEYKAEATKGDYDHLIQTTMEWVTTE